MSRRRPTSGRRQRGVSMGGAMIVIVLVVFFATLAVQMLPTYVTFWQVRGLMDRVAEQPEVIKAGRGRILTTLDNQLNVDGIRSLNRSDFEIVKTGEGLELSVDYEVRKHLFFNVDVLMSFAHTTVLKAP